MSGQHDAVVEAVKLMLGELPMEFSMGPPDVKGEGRSSFTVIKKRNVRRVHEGLWAIQEYLGMTDD